VRIVIVGGGVAGHLLARATQDHHQVVLVEPRDHFAVPIALPRLLVEPELGERALIPYADFLPGVEHVRARATRVTPDAVHTDTGQVLDADAIALATGSAYRPDPALFPPTPDRADRLQAARDLAERLRRARRVLVVGGGPVGVEVAAELAHEHPGCRIMLVHAGSRLLPGATPAAADQALRWLRSNRVRVLLDDRVDLPEHAVGGPFAGSTRAGVGVQADVALRFVGYRPDLSYLDLGADVLDSDGRIRVRPTLQLAEHEHILALGDITDLPERKLAMYAARHADVAASTLRALAQGRAPSTTHRPATGATTMLVTLGRSDGIVSLPVGALRWPWLARRLKSSDVMVRKYRERIGLGG